MQKNAKSSEKSIACDIFSEMKKTGVGRPLLLLAEVSKSFYTIHSVCRRAQKNGNCTELSGELLWLSENYFNIEKEYRVIRTSLRKCGKLQLSGRLPRLFSGAKKYLEKCNGKLGCNEVHAIITVLDNNTKDGCSCADLDSAQLLIKSAVICYIGSLCEALCCNDEADSTAPAEAVSNSIKTLKYLSAHLYEDSIGECLIENTLARDPAGVYQGMSEGTKALYRKNLARLAKKRRVSEYALATEIVETASKGDNEKSRHIGTYLLTPAKGGRLYFALWYIAGFALALVFSGGNPFIYLLLTFPVREAVKQLFDFIYPKICKKSSPILPRLELDAIPESATTLCVITTLLCGEKNDSTVFDRLEKIYNANSGENIYFGILGDLPDSDTATTSADESIKAYARGRISSLNTKYGNHFFFFVRNRRYSKSEKRFMAYERKRGALVELVRLIKGKSTSFDTQELPEAEEENGILKKVKYLLTLDADTNLSLDGVKTLVSIMLHPCNRPVIDYEKGIVTEGYGVLQPKMAPSLDSAEKTAFSRIMCGSGGIDIYSGATYDTYQTLFGEGVFCGKGIFDADAFYEVTDNLAPFPEDYILSHDILEGARLRAGLVSDMELTDSFPKNEISYFKRLHRWIRGDIQNLRFLFFGYHAGGKYYKNRFSVLSRYKILDNGRRTISEILCLAGIAVSCYLPEKRAHLVIFASLLPYILPFLLDTVSLFCTFAANTAARRFFSKGATSGIWQSFMRMLLLISMLCKNAFLSFGAIILTFYRMFISKTKLLEWVTAVQADSGEQNILFFISKNILSAVAGALLFIFAPYGVQKILGFMFFILPVVAYLTSKGTKQKSPIAESDKKKLYSYACDIWKFFSENVTASDNFLPPDNIQLIPCEKTAHRTSPTNIGLYLVSTLAARDFELIDSLELCRRTSDTLSTIERLPKWKGNLFNWYDTENCEILFPPFISSVDSGNLVACLITLRSGLSEYTGEAPELVEVIKRVSALIGSTDLACLYNKDRNLFSLGITVNDNDITHDENCYDMLMSEARILSYIAVSSRTVPKRHWQALGRPLISSSGYIGLASWSGTAFEYFMPPLFLPFKKGSMLYEAMLFTLREQKKQSIRGVWGISESGFFSFDRKLNFQYKAFGVPSLGLIRGLEKETVISPYSVFLSMCVDRKSALYNLDRLSRMGLYGKYGLYEAVDFTPQRVKADYAPVKSYMSHHLGMSLAALCNSAFGNILAKRFIKDPGMSAGSELLEEKIPVDAVIRRVTKHPLSQEKSLNKPKPFVPDPFDGAQ